MDEIDFEADDFADIIAKDKRYNARGYAFLMDVVHYLSGADDKHVSGEAVLDEFKERALDQYGPLAFTVLTEWGILTTSDIGEMMFNLVDASRVHKDENDSSDAFFKRLRFQGNIPRPLPDMKKLRILFAASAALTVLSALAFFNNLVAIVNWWRAFVWAGGDTSGVPAHAPGCFAWLDWTAVDYSAVTTFIPFLGFFFLTRAAGALLKGKRLPADDFPFFRGSDQLNVALGLFGTLWGIIVIGYFKLETVQMADLMQCLHTALFSTLMAVVWVFLIDRPLIRPYFLKLLNELNLAETDEGDLAGAVERLVGRLDAASEAFDRRQVAYEKAFEKRQKEYNEFFRREIAELERKTEAAEKRAAAFESKLKAVAAALHE